MGYLALEKRTRERKLCVMEFGSVPGQGRAAVCIGKLTIYTRRSAIKGFLSKARLKIC
jgi:hypothetical protein